MLVPPPICVHAPPAAPPPVILAVVGICRSRLGGAHGGARPPAPAEADGRRGRLPRRAAANGGAEALLADRDPVAHLDRGSSFALVDAGPARRLRARPRRRARVARAPLAFGAGDGRGQRAAESQMLARLAVPCAARGRRRTSFQAEPERTLVDPGHTAFDRGASLFFDWLDANFGARARAPSSTGLWARSPTTHRRSASRWAAARPASTCSASR